MKTVAGYLRRDPAEVKPWAETCGQIRPLIEEADEAAGEIHRIVIIVSIHAPPDQQSPRELEGIARQDCERN